MGNKVIYPVDSASFRGIREGNKVYVDKTQYIDLLTSRGTYYFLARPRRFGKSLFLDTLAEYFRGNKDLFKGLAIEKLQPGEWESYPVLRFNLSGIICDKSSALNGTLHSTLQQIEKSYGLDRGADQISDRFEILISNLANKYGKKVVILIDEYDAPLTSSIDKPELQEVYRDQLRGFYSVLKKAEEYIRFCFLTGVTRYGKVSVFSGLNNLNDITFDNRFAAICGITKEELREYYQEGIEDLAKEKGLTIEETYQLLKFHYDGYHFSPSMVDIYNPFSINYAFDRLVIQDYWCQSGTPTILAMSLMENDYDIRELQGMKVDQSALSDLSMFKMNPIPLFYQTGYLTLKDYDPRRERYTLGYPNREVESGILNNIVKFYTSGKNNVRNLVFDIEDALEEGNPREFIKLLSSFLSDIPSRLHEIVRKYENYYHTIFYCIFKLLGLDIDAEYNTSEGFIDILIKTDKYIYIIELKVNGSAEDAIRQIEEKHYAAPFVADSRRLYKVGIGFSKETGTVNSSVIL